MRSALWAAVATAALSGCAPGPYWTAPSGVSPPGAPPPAAASTPILVPTADHQYVWETVVDVVNDYFKIEREEPVRAAGNTLTEGRLDTYPQMGATLLEPWYNDSANAYERLESTLQTIRRRAIVRVMPAQGGFWVDVAVFKELENLVQPEHSTVGAATFRYDNTLTRVINPGPAKPINQGWIPQGRDPALEQRILGQLAHRFGIPTGSVLPTQPWAY